MNGMYTVYYTHNWRPSSSRGVLKGRWSALWPKYNKKTIQEKTLLAPIEQMCCRPRSQTLVFEQIWADSQVGVGYKRKAPVGGSRRRSSSDVAAAVVDRSFAAAGTCTQTPAWLRPPDSRSPPKKEPSSWSPPSPCRTTTTPTCSTSSR